MATMTLTETTEMIQALRTDAGTHGDSDLVEMCDRVLVESVELLDSDTNEQLTAEDLGIDATRYVNACCESLDCGQAEGHVRVNGRRVYAA
jgi:hypothetical protein